MSEPQTFDNGLNTEQMESIVEARTGINHVIALVDALPRHRSLSLAITKLEEAKHWLEDRKHKPPS